MTKTKVMKKVAKKLKCEATDTRLANIEPCDLKGMPETREQKILKLSALVQTQQEEIQRIREEKTKACYMVTKTFQSHKRATERYSTLSHLFSEVDSDMSKTLLELELVVKGK